MSWHVGMVLYLCFINVYQAQLIPNLFQTTADEILGSIFGGVGSPTPRTKLQEEVNLKPGCSQYMRKLGGSGMLHAAATPATKRTMQNMGIASASINVVKQMKARLGDSFNALDFLTNEVDIGKSQLKSLCPDNMFYEKNDERCNLYLNQQSISGRCNNLNHPLWGASSTGFSRLLFPAYGDGISSPKTVSSVGNVLPSARHVSNCMSPKILTNHTVLTTAAVFFGQFVDHDLTLTPIVHVEAGEGEEARPPQCCNVPDNCKHPECFEISIPPNDPFYSFFGETCMEFVRSVPAIGASCSLGVREQTNQNTHLLDASHVYGSDEERASELRVFRDGLMKINNEVLAREGFEVLPEAEDDLECARDDNNGRACFLGGDMRTNENTVLNGYHTIFIREHNRIARVLKRLALEANIFPNDEKLYQAARKIVIAENQHITFAQWLPVILGPIIYNGDSGVDQILRLCEPSVKKSYCRGGYFTGYSPDVPPIITNEFATAAYRFGHTLLTDEIFRFRPKKAAFDALPLKDRLFRTFEIYERDATEEFFFGSSIKKSEEYDSVLVDAIRNLLFVRDKPFGMDLYALNIQRSRDHALRSYNDYRELCGLRRVQTFQDLLDVMDQEAINRLRCAYKDVNDIELFPGGLSELSVNFGDGVLGPTFACIIAQQYYALRAGDRFWYENPGVFTTQQLAEIRKISIAHLVCMNSNVPHYVEAGPSSFFKSVNDPNIRPCKSSMNLRVFLDLVR